MKIAISGGTGGVGRAIVDALESKYDYVILTRSLPLDLDPQLKSKCVIVDYTDTAGLVAVLERHDVHTVVSAVSLVPSGAGEAQLSLIRAADKSRVTKRFIPSEFSLPSTEKVINAIPYQIHKANAAKLLEQTSLEWTIIHSGMFLDYWGLPHYPSHLAPVHFSIDMENNFAVIPGSGRVPAVLTHSSDIGLYIASMLGFSDATWPRECFIIGDKLTFDEFVGLAEEAKGRKFEIIKDSVEHMELGLTTELPIQKVNSLAKPYSSLETTRQIFANLGLLIESGAFNFSDDLATNAKFPGIVPKKASEIFGAWRAR